MVMVMLRNQKIGRVGPVGLVWSPFGAAVASSLLSPERSAWIYGGGAPSRQQRGGNCHRNENGWRARHRRPIRWADPEQHRGNQAARNHREREAGDGPGCGKSEAAAKQHRHP